MESSCIKCDHRYTACWQTCPDYKEYRKKLDLIKEKREKSRKLRESIEIIESGRYKRGPVKRK